jgi:hypothetical protein
VRSYADWDRTGEQWFGAAEAASGPRPGLHAYARFCTPRTDEHAVTYLVEVQGFGTDEEAATWMEALREASADGMPLANWRDYTGQPGPEDEACAATATSSAESEVAGAAFEVSVDSLCRDTGSPPGFQRGEEGGIQVGDGLETNVDGVEADPPDYTYDHEPDAYTMGATGSWTCVGMV